MDNVEEKNITKEEQPQNEINEIAKLLDKDMFFSAAVANKKTNAVHKKRLEVEMLEIYKEINNAINAGEYSITLWLTKDQQNFLYNKNFRLNGIEKGSNKIKYQIYWN